MNFWSIVQPILFALFALLTAALSAIIAPTYDHLFVPEMQPAALYPPLTGAAAHGSVFGNAAAFSGYLLTGIVDPAIALGAIGLGVAYLVRSVGGRWALSIDSFLVRLIVAVFGANFALPIAGGVLSVAGAAFPVFSGWDGGAWQHWDNLAGPGLVSFSWSNGALAFILAFALFALVFLLALAIGVRDGLLAVLLVVLPLFTLLAPFPIASQLARRAWLLFVELAFLPCVLVIPLELAVGSPNIVLLLSLLTVALASPYLLSLSGQSLSGFGFPSAGTTVAYATQRGLSSASYAGANYTAPLAGGTAGGAVTSGGRSAGLALRSAGSAGLPAAGPVLVAEAVGRGASHLIHHLRPGGPDRDGGAHGRVRFRVSRDRPTELP